MHMQKEVPQQNTFKTAELLDRWQSRLTYAAVLFSLFDGILHFFPVDTESCWFYIIQFLPKIILLTAVVALILKLFFVHVYRHAEDIRRDSFFDNSFGCFLSDKQSKGYFSNDSTPLGLYKALVNLDENCTYSVDIINHMYIKRASLAAISAVILLAVMLFSKNDKQFFMLLFNPILSLELVEKIFNLHSLKQNLGKVHEKCKHLLSEWPKDESSISTSYHGIVIREIVRYESSLAYASIMFDSKYFARINSKKEKEWTDYKKRLISNRNS